MKCSQCGDQMEAYQRETTYRQSPATSYDRTYYRCQSDDIWLIEEKPQTSRVSREQAETVQSR
jgi:hypothetical protein